jgi:hypothetical protein
MFSHYLPSDYIINPIDKYKVRPARCPIWFWTRLTMVYGRYYVYIYIKLASGFINQHGHTWGVTARSFPMTFPWTEEPEKSWGNHRFPTFFCTFTPGYMSKNRLGLAFFGHEAGNIELWALFCEGWGWGALNMKYARLSYSKHTCKD